MRKTCFYNLYSILDQFLFCEFAVMFMRGSLLKRNKNSFSATQIAFLIAINSNKHILFFFCWLWKIIKRTMDHFIQQTSLLFSCKNNIRFAVLKDYTVLDYSPWKNQFIAKKAIHFWLIATSSTKSCTFYGVFVEANSLYCKTVWEMYFFRREEKTISLSHKKLVPNMLCVLLEIQVRFYVEFVRSFLWKWKWFRWQHFPLELFFGCSHGLRN